MESRYNYDIIRDYLHGLVDRKTAHEIGELIKKDETARSIAEGILLIECEFNDNDQDIESYLENFQNTQTKHIETQTGISVKQTKAFPWIKVAASILILITFGYGISFLSTEPDFAALMNQELADPYPASGIVRGPGSDSDFNRALQLYINKNYTQAALYFEKASHEESDKATAVFYNALSSLYAGNYNRAIELFKSRPVVVSRYSQQSRWYLGLTYFKSENNVMAIETLEPVKNDTQHFKHESALRLLKALD